MAVANFGPIDLLVMPKLVGHGPLYAASASRPIASRCPTAKTLPTMMNALGKGRGALVCDTAMAQFLPQ
jgi:hypothetical protein